jgi:glycosyltransferase involved in cell wall biosynthesis
MIKNKPLVSVIIPVYNRYKLAYEAVISVQNQTYDNTEIIIVDDGSNDNTEKLSQIKNIKYIKQKHTGFPGQVRNRGALDAKGDYLAFLDSDDLFLNEKLSRQVYFFNNHPDISICHTKEIWKRENRIISQARQKHKRQGNIFKDALVKCIIGPSTVMIKKKLFFSSGMFNPGLEIAEDYELWLRICNNNEIGYIEDPLIIKRAGNWNQLSWKYEQIEIFRINALLLNLENHTFKGKNLLLAKKELTRKCRIYANGCMKRGKIIEADKYKKIADLHK